MVFRLPRPTKWGIVNLTAARLLQVGVPDNDFYSDISPTGLLDQTAIGRP